MTEIPAAHCIECNCVPTLDFAVNGLHLICKSCGNVGPTSLYNIKIHPWILKANAIILWNIENERYGKHIEDGSEVYDYR